MTATVGWVCSHSSNYGAPFKGLVGREPGRAESCSGIPFMAVSSGLCSLTQRFSDPPCLGTSALVSSLA